LTFLKEINPLLRLQIQFYAFEETEHLKIVNELLKLDTFEFENVRRKTLDFTALNIEKKLRLGNRLEYFFLFGIMNSDEIVVLANNIQIIENKITLGELDFIVQNKSSNDILHIELANKFYLLDKNKKWIGPNKKDSLLQKIAKLKEKQFPLLFHKRTKDFLLENKIDLNIKQRIVFKTQLFVPKNDFLGVEYDKGIYGYYINWKQFLELENQNFKFFIPEKQDWQVNPEYGENWFEYNFIKSTIKFHLSENKSPLIWMRQGENEYVKFFVVWW